MNRICGRRADRLFSRGFGERDGKCINLHWVELAYLVEKGIVDGDFPRIFKEASSSIEDFDIRFLVYRDLRDRGYVLRVEGDAYRGRKSYSMLFYPLSSLDRFSPRDFLGREFPLMLAVVDLDGEITYYLVDIHEPKGDFMEIPERVLKVHHLGNRAVIFQSIADFERKTYGRDEGNWGHLSAMEARYLAEKGLMEWRGEEETVYGIYRDLRERGLIVKSGFKYGTHFRVYEHSLEEHSKYLVHVLSGDEEIEKISRAVRVAHGVRKSLLLAYRGNKTVYFKFSWVRP